MRNDAALLQQTALADLHHELGGKMVPFAGYRMPLHFSAGIIREHQHTRSAAGFFDISHMGQIRIAGDQVVPTFERIVPSRISRLTEGQLLYTVLTTDDGGIFDDLIMALRDDELLLVVNAARKFDDLTYLQSRLPDHFVVAMEESQALLAIQGPQAVGVVESLFPGSEKIPFMHSAKMTFGGIICWLSRCGYTGEDGYEISLPAEKAEDLARALLQHVEVQPIGLGARDSLRLEAGLCLYGHDIDVHTSLVEAGLAWVISPKYRGMAVEDIDFPGARRIIDELQNGPRRRRVGLLVNGRAPVREGAEIHDQEGVTVGRITSGGYSPTLRAPIAMGYVDTDKTVPGSGLFVVRREQPVAVTVSALPFVVHRYKELNP